MSTRDNEASSHLRVRAVGFDCFGTLIGIGTRLGAYERLAVGADLANARRSFMTQNVSIEELARSIGLAQLGGELAHALRAELATLYAYPDVEPALSSLRDRGVQIAVCSNLAAGYGQAVRNLLPQINNFVFSYEVGAVKPEPAIYAEICRRLNVAPADVLFVGDSPHCDVDGPSAVGMHGRLLSRTSGQTLPALLNIHT